MTNRPSLPGADVLFGVGRAATPPPAPAKPTANAKVPLYLAPELLAEVDMWRATLQRDEGVRVDRSRVIREALRQALADPVALTHALMREEAS